LLSGDFILSHQGRDVALLDVATFREAARIEIDGEELGFEREGRRSGAFLLRRGDEVLARAVKPGVFKNRFELEAAGERYEVAKVSWWGREFEVLAQGRRIGGIRPAGVFTRRARVELPPDWPLPLQVFVFWLVLVLWNRAAAAAAAGGGG
jgi:hypothetical protein